MLISSKIIIIVYWILYRGCCTVRGWNLALQNLNEQKFETKLVFGISRDSEKFCSTKQKLKCTVHLVRGPNHSSSAAPTQPHRYHYDYNLLHECEDITLRPHSKNNSTLKGCARERVLRSDENWWCAVRQVERCIVLSAHQFSPTAKLRIESAAAFIFLSICRRNLIFLYACRQARAKSFLSVRLLANIYSCECTQRIWKHV
jgi:hypothetical protein